MTGSGGFAGFGPGKRQRDPGLRRLRRRQRDRDEPCCFLGRPRSSFQLQHEDFRQHGRAPWFAPYDLDGGGRIAVQIDGGGGHYGPPRGLLPVHPRPVVAIKQIADRANIGRAKAPAAIRLAESLGAIAIEEARKRVFVNRCVASRC